ncbi:endonuclease/exonuclease/phosphatase family protein [Micromonospora haikouensis]|uniref:endonuclease/exonuclease/phosphatase family protein n=1 Tax=Micromonospora haikouensis TaxID=686309 RepID=UPI0036CB7839
MIPVALFNFEAGGLRHGQRNLRPLVDAFHDVQAPPALILLCEAKTWHENGQRPLHHAAELLADRFDRPYVGVLGHDPHSPMPPAILYDPTLLTLRSWPAPADPHVFADKRNIAVFAIRGTGAPGTPDSRTTFAAAVTHWDPHCGIRRRQQAALLDRYGTTDMPVIVGGDLNSTASGPHLPQRDWAAAGHRARAQKARRHPDGTWTADTDAVDHLIGRWDPETHRRIDGCGFHALAELARNANPHIPLLPTVNNGIDVGGGLLIDWLLANDAMRPHVDPGSYRVHVPARQPYPSDHRLVTATLVFDTPPPTPRHHPHDRPPSPSSNRKPAPARAVPTAEPASARVGRRGSPHAQPVASGVGEMFPQNDTYHPHLSHLEEYG